MKKTLKIKKVKQNAKLPIKGTPGSAGYDLFSAHKEERVIAPGEVVTVETGVAIELPDEYTVGLVFARSGLATKKGLSLINGVGVIDSDYRGELCVVLKNFSDKPYCLLKGERVAQLVLVPIMNLEIELVQELSETIRGEQGFGSTGR